MIHMTFQVDVMGMLNDKQCYKVFKFMVTAIVTTATTGIAYLNLVVI